jgi:colanic acid biosynthesis glycosyl transferase WcaI
MKITVIGINYAPEVTGIAPYTTGLAEGLAREGHDVTVVTGLPHYPEWRITPGYESRQPTVVNGVSIRRVKHHVPTVPSPRGRVRMEASFAQAAVRARWGRPDLVIAISPTLLSSAAVVARARMLRIPCGVVVQDLYSRGVVETGAMSGTPARLAARFEGGVLATATGVCVIHDRFVDIVEKLGVKRADVTVIRNWTHLSTDEGPSRQSREQVRAAFGWRSDDIVAVHAGNMGVKQYLQNVVAAGRLQDDCDGGNANVRFVLIGDGNQRTVLEREADTVKSVSILDTLPDSDFRGVLRAADVLLVNEKPGVGEMAVPSKLTSYFVSGRPVVAATDPTSGTAHEITLSGGGTLVPPGDPAALLSAVVAVGSDATAGAQMGVRAREFASTTLGAQQAIDAYASWCQSLVTRSG